MSLTPLSNSRSVALVVMILITGAEARAEGAPDKGTQQCVCEMDSFCCSAWDSLCDYEATKYCAATSESGPSKTVQACVCDMDAFCCTGWDSICESEATNYCAGGKVGGAADDPVKACVCAMDTYCCSGWDSICQKEADVDCAGAAKTPPPPAPDVAGQACACAVSPDCCDSWTQACATLASTISCYAPPDLELSASAWSSLAEMIDAPGLVTAAALYPERTRARLLQEVAGSPDLVSSNALYDFESCRAYADFAGELSRVRTDAAGDLDGLASLTAAGHMSWPSCTGSSCDGTSEPCPSGGCFLRVITRHVGRDVTVSAAGVTCEDPTTGTQSQCTFGPGSESEANAGAGYRGNVIIAKRITIAGTIDLGANSLVLLATRSIEMSPGSKIVGPGSLPTPPTTSGATPLSQITGYYSHCLGVQRLCGGYGDCSTYEDFVQRPRTSYLEFHQGLAGRSDNTRPGSLVLLAPQVLGSGELDMAGRRGGAGAPGANAACNYDDMGCIESVNYLGAIHSRSNGSPGGDGGAGGRIVVRSAHALPKSIQLSVAGGVGGVGGAPGQLTVSPHTCPGYGQHHEYTPGTHIIGEPGAKGQMGPPGAVDIGALGEDIGAYATLLARRGAERHMEHGKLLARNIAAPGHQAGAIQAFEVVARHYCGVAGITLATAKPTTVVPGFNAPVVTQPHPLYVARYGVGVDALPYTAADRRAGQQTVDATAAICAEREARVARVLDAVNVLGFPADFKMPLRQDIMAELRERVLDEVDLQASLFWEAVEAASNSFDAQVIAERATGVAEEKTRALGIALSKRERLSQQVVFSVAGMERNQASLDDLNQRVTQLQTEIQTKLAPPPCGWMCVLGQFISAVQKIAQIATAGYSLVSSIGDFVAGFINLDFDDVYTAVRLENMSGTETQSDYLEAIGKYANQVATGIEVGGKKYAGLGTVAGRATALGDRFSKIKGAFGTIAGLIDPAVPPALTAIAELSLHQDQTETDLLDGLAKVDTVIASVEAGGNYTDRLGALARLRTMRQLVLRQLGLNADSQTLLEDHVLATMELETADEEVVLAELSAANAAALSQRTLCRIGELPAAQCSGIIALGSSAAIGHLRDELCGLARHTNETFLFLDFLYERSRDFVLLRDNAAALDPTAIAANDFSRNLLLPGDRLAVSQNAATVVLQDFLTALNGRQPRVNGGAFCVAPGACAAQATGPASDRVMGDLLRHGRAHFEVSTPTNERVRQRVTHFDLRLDVAPGYRLGCRADLACPAGPLSAPDSSVVGVPYMYAYAHDSRASFLWDDGSVTSLFFSPSWTAQACEVAKTWLPANDPYRTIDCRELPHFQGYGDYETSATRFPSSQVVQSGDFVKSSILGTSVRGGWTVDIRDTITALGALDGCYDATGIPADCLPSRCLNPCFDAAGARLPTGVGPERCDCYDSTGQIAVPTGASCQGLPATLTHTLPDAEAPEECRVDAMGRTGYDFACAPYTVGGNLQPTGSGLCCTPGGHVLDAASSNPTCQTLGLTSDEACVTPDACYEICGPRCKALKDNLNGFEYRIYSREG